jgi:hypothetical protein
MRSVYCKTTEHAIAYFEFVHMRTEDIERGTKSKASPNQRDGNKITLVIHLEFASKITSFASASQWHVNC